MPRKTKGIGSTVSINEEGKRTVIITDENNIDPDYLRKNKEYQERKKKEKKYGKFVIKHGVH